MGGGQRPFGFFPKIHPLWWPGPSLRKAKTNLDASDVEDKVDMVDMVDWPLPREGPRTEEQVNVLLAVKDEFANSSSSLVLEAGFLNLCSEKSSKSRFLEICILKWGQKPEL